MTEKINFAVLNHVKRTGNMKLINDIIAEIAIEYYSHFPQMREDILHTQEVASFTRLIAVNEGLTERQTQLMEAAAWLHDIGCPRAKIECGNSLPANQQRVGRIVTDELLEKIESLTIDEKKWLADVVGTHHQFQQAIDLRFEPLFEADLIVNLLSGYYAMDKAKTFYTNMMTTESGKRLFKTLIQIEE